MAIIDNLYEKLLEIPVMDPHSHVDASHLCARGLEDILLYHMVISDLYSAGCPSGNRLPEHPDESDSTFRIEQAIPYLEYIQNTSCYWGVKIILRELYGWDQPLTLENWRQLDEIIKKKCNEKDRAKEILKKANIDIMCTDLWRDRDRKLGERFKYSFEWAFFMRCQSGQFDTALIELENTWGQSVPGEPLPFIFDKDSISQGKRIMNVNDVDEALDNYCNNIPFDKLVCTAMHLSTDIDYSKVTKEEMQTAIERRETAGIKERDIYAAYILDNFLCKMDKRKERIIIQFSLGAEPLPYETGSKLKADTVYQLSDIIKNHPSLNFQIFLSSEHQDQSLCTLVREHNNLSLAGYWWHNFFPTIIRKVMGERLDMVASNKQIAFMSDAYCLEWAYAKVRMVKRQMAVVLAEKIEQGQYDMDQALVIARKVLFETPKSIFLGSI